MRASPDYDDRQLSRAALLRSLARMRPDPLRLLLLIVGTTVGGVGAAIEGDYGLAAWLLALALLGIAIAVLGVIVTRREFARWRRSIQR